MTIIIYIVLFVIAIVLQLTVAPLFAIEGIAPDLVLLVVVFVAMKRGKVWGIAAGFVAGLAYDFFGTAFLGVSSLANSVAAFLAGLLGGPQFEEKPAEMIGLLATSVFIHHLIYFTIIRIGSFYSFGQLLVRVILPQSFYTLVFVAIFYSILPKSSVSHGSGYSKR